MRLCSRQRRPVIRGDSIFPVHPSDSTVRVLIIIKSLTNRGSTPQTPISLSSFLTSVLLPASSLLPYSLSLARSLHLFPHPFSVLLRFFRFPYRSMANGPNRFPSQLTIATRKLDIEALKLQSDGFESLV